MSNFKIFTGVVGLLLLILCIFSFAIGQPINSPTLFGVGLVFLVISALSK